MEQLLAQNTSDNSILFYRVQIKAIEVSQLLQIQGSRLTENEVKNITNENLNVFGMSQKLFNEGGLSHLFELVRQLCLNYNSIIVLLTDRIEKEHHRLHQIQRAATEGEEQSDPNKDKAEGHVSRPGLSLKQMRLGGVSLYNENYCRFVEDKRVLEQINLEREKHNRKTKQDIMDSILVQELMEGEDVKDKIENDEVADFITQGRKKKARFSHYTSFEPELNNIMEFFQNAQTEAKEFLSKRGRVDRKQTVTAHFSFSDFEREIHFKQMEFKKEVIEKVNIFLAKIKRRERDLEAYIDNKEMHYREIEDRIKNGKSLEVQTEFEFEEHLRRMEAERKDMQIRCVALENMKFKEEEYMHRENELRYDLTVREREVERLTLQKKEYEGIIIAFKRSLKEDRSRKFIPNKEESDKSIKVVEDLQENRSSHQIEDFSNSGRDVHEEPSHNGRTALGGHWKRKASDGVSSFLSMNQIDNDQAAGGAGGTGGAGGGGTTGTKTSTGIAATAASRGGQDTAKAVEKKKYSKYSVNVNKQEMRSIGEEQEGLIRGLMRGLSVEYGIQTDEEQDPYGPEYYQWEREAEAAREHIRRASNLSDQSSLSGQEISNSLERGKPDEAGSKGKKRMASNSLREKARFSSQELAKRLSSREKERISLNEKGRLSLRKNIVKEPDSQTSKQDSPQKVNPRRPSKAEKLPASKERKTRDTERKSRDVERKSRGTERGSRQIERKNKDTDSIEQDHYLEEEKAKPKTVYRMFDVVEEKEDEFESIQNTQHNLGKMDRFPISSKVCSNDPSVQVISEKAERNQEVMELYSLTIYPTQREDRQEQKQYRGEQYQERREQYKERERGEQSQRQTGKLKPNHSRTSTEFTLGGGHSVHQREKTADGIIQILSDISKTNDSPKNTMINSWKRQLLDHYKEDLLSAEQVQTIAAVVDLSTHSGHKKREMNQTHGMHSHSPLIETGNRKSLPQIDPRELMKIMTISKHSNKRGSFVESNRSGSGRMEIDEEKRLNELIKESALETDFISKFKKAHASCREGPVCHHVERYLETVMKMIQDVKLKQRASLTIHIENIGTALDKENAEWPASKKSHLNSPSAKSPPKELGLVIQEHISMTKYARQSLHKMINNGSGSTGLPFIKENKNSLSYK